MFLFEPVDRRLFEYGSIEASPMHFVQTQVIERPVSELFAFVSDPENRPRWHYCVSACINLDTTPAPLWSPSPLPPRPSGPSLPLPQLTHHPPPPIPSRPPPPP